MFYFFLIINASLKYRIGTRYRQILKIKRLGLGSGAKKRDRDIPTYSLLFKQSLSPLVWLRRLCVHLYWIIAEIRPVERLSATVKLIWVMLNVAAVSGDQLTEWVFKAQDRRIERMDGGVCGPWRGGWQMASEWARSSEARPVSLSSTTLSPTCCCSDTQAALPYKERTHTHTHTVAHTVTWDLSGRKDSLKDSWKLSF